MNKKFQSSLKVNDFYTASSLEELSMSIVSKKKGKFTDHLSNEEVAFSKQAAKALKEINTDWTKNMLNNAQIKNAIEVIPNEHRSYSDFNHIKSALFEIRFAYNLHQAGITNIKYEHCRENSDRSIDFKIVDKNGYTWLIELTSLRESSVIKSNTNEFDKFFSYSSNDYGSTKNSDEIRELIKVQNAILGKVFDKDKVKPTKFPNIDKKTKKTIHMILIDMRSPLIGTFDDWDYFNIVHGSEHLKDNQQGVYCRYNDKREFFKGIFDPNHPNPTSSHIREKIHIIGFAKEENYTEQELIKNIKLFFNPILTKDMDIFKNHAKTLSLIDLIINTD